MQDPGIIISFIAGIFSIVSPCILPVIPSFIAYITGLSVSENYKQIDKKSYHRKLIIDTLLFGIGFSTVFLLLGAAVGSLGEFLLLNRPIFEKIAGVMIIFFGLQLTGIIKIQSLLKQKNWEIPEKLKKISYLRSLFIGIFFSFSWAPCYGPIIGAIFTLAATKANFWQAVLLFLFYSLGFMLPLLLITIFISKANLFVKKVRKFTKYSSLISGIFVIILGVLLLTNQMGTIVNWVNFIYLKNHFTFL